MASTWPDPGGRLSTGRSNNGVEIDFTTTGVLVRDGLRYASTTAIGFTPTQWAEFLNETVHGLPSHNGAAVVSLHDGLMHLRSTTSSTVLHFTAGQWAAFVAGARDGRYTYRAPAPATPVA